MIGETVSVAALPRRLRTKSGRERIPPDCISEVMRCSECGSTLVSSGENWGCPKNLGHVKLIHDEVMRSRIGVALQEVKSRWRPDSLIRFLKYRQRWLEQ